METQELDFLAQYESSLTKNIVDMLTHDGMLDGAFLDSPDISDKWKEIAPYYMADAVKEIAQYPNVALGWAMYMGMAVASMWDRDWERYSQIENLYEYVRNIRGFDYLDEVVREQILGLHDAEFKAAEQLVQRCSQMALDAIRHEQIESQSPMAFHVFARSTKVLFNAGAATVLFGLGYKLVKA
ncbi:MAG: hypothetical protein MJZ01_01650 [Bacteroidales bacterium]|nr:hypothetical protein [Bacteroidales bacterium]